MPLLEVTQTRQISASIRLTDTTATAGRSVCRFHPRFGRRCRRAGARLCLHQRPRVPGLPEVARSSRRQHRRFVSAEPSASEAAEAACEEARKRRHNPWLLRQV